VSLRRHRTLRGASGGWSRVRKEASSEGVVVRAGESVALTCSTLNASAPLRVALTCSLAGAPARTFSAVYFTSAIANDVAVLAIVNDVGSGQALTIRSVSVEEVGTFDSPYLQLVPSGGLIEAEAAEQPTIVKLDTLSPDPFIVLDARIDCPMLPRDMPENALADSSTGSPKGFSYLKTKDFLGPVYRAIFPEGLAHRPGLVPDAIGAHAQRYGDIFVQRAGITIREGEGIALVSAAETAAGATASVGVSGWSSFEFAAVFDVEPKSTPTLSITGLHSPSEVRIFSAGTTIELAGQEDVTSGSFAWVYDPDDVTSVDIAILSLGRQNIRLTSVALGLSDASIPVQQQVDRQYSNV
jgi:hypothetical protein